MTIQELHETAPETQQFYISENGYITELHRLSGVELAAYGDFIIGNIEARAGLQLRHIRH